MSITSGTPMILCVTEKPSVAKDIAHILGADARRDGYYEGNGYQVSWTFGHLCELKEPGDYTDMWKRWSLSALPMIPLRFGIKIKDDEGVQRQFHVIETLIGTADEVINCGDAGQEGELIQRWVYQKAGCKKPVKRLWISSLTDESIRKGFNHLQPASDFDNLYYAGLSRAVGDWVLGNYSRFVRPGYKRVDLGGADDINALMGSAYLSPDGKKAVAVYFNMGHTDRTVSIDITGQAVRIDSIKKYTTSANYALTLDRNLPATYNGEAIEIPARSVETLVMDLVPGSGSDPFDINHDGIVDVLDLNIVINVILNLPPGIDPPFSADVTNDGIVDILDVNAIINRILGLDQ